MARNHAVSLAKQEEALAKKKQKKKKRIITLVIILSVIGLLGGTVATLAIVWPEEFKHYATHPGHLAGVIFKPDETEPFIAGSKTVAVCRYEWIDAVSGETENKEFKIPYEELRFITMFYKDSLCQKYGEGIWNDPATAERYRPELESLVHENINQNYAILASCLKEGVDIEHKAVDKYVDQQIEQLKGEFNSTKEYKAWLEEHWMNESYMRFSISVDFLESSLYYALLDGGRFAYSDSNINAFKEYVANSEDYVRTIHVYIENAEGESPAANLARAQEISADLQSITDPTERRKKMSEYIGSVDNDDLLSVTGDGYYFTRYEMDEVYEEASFGLEIGEVSDAVVCSGGNFVIMRLSPEAAYIDKNVADLLDNYHGMAMGVYEDNVRAGCVVTFNDFGKSIDLVGMR